MSNFLNPLAALFAITLPIIVLMYLLKLKRTRMVLSSTMLWRKSIEDLIANAPFQKLRRNLLMYIQLLIAALLVLALMRPLYKMQGGAGIKYIVLIDTSASMKTTDGEAGRTRMEQARAAAEDLVNKMAKGDTMTLLKFANRSELLQSNTVDRELLRSKLRELEAVDTPTDITEALLIADTLARPEYQQGGQVEDTGDAAAYDPRSRIVIISDGKFGAKQLQMTQVANINFIKIGQEGDNVGFTVMDISLDLERAAVPVVFASVKNFGAEPQNRLVHVFLDDNEFDSGVKALSLEPGQESTLRFRPFGENAEDITSETLTVPHKVRLTLSPYSEDEDNDIFALDDEAYGIIAPQRPMKILVVTAGNFFIEQMLALIPNSQVDKTSPANFVPSEEYDITIFDSFAPPELPLGNFIFFGAVPPLPGFELAEDQLENPFIVDWNRVHLLTRFVNFDNIYIEKALNIKPPPWARVMVEANSGPVIFAFEREGRRGVVIALDFATSDWGLKISYPIFLSNTIRWLSQSTEGYEKSVKRTGEALPLEPKTLATKFTIVNPAGDEHEITIEDGKTYPFTATEKVGFYDEISGDNLEEKRTHAFNLMSIEESEVAPQEDLEIGRDIIEASDSVLTENREIWRYLLWAALIFLVVEWYIYCRRSWT